LLPHSLCRFTTANAPANRQMPIASVVSSNFRKKNIYAMKRLEFGLIILVIVSFIYGCKEKSTQKINESSTTDSIAGQHLSELQYEDSLHNPFITKNETGELKDSDKFESLERRFDHIVGKFKSVDLPIAFGPKPTPYHRTEVRITDSLFIVNCLEDKYMYQNYPDIMSAYVKGKIIDKTPNYILIVFLHLYDMGFDYQLYSFTHKGKLISKADIGGEGPDWYEDYGVIDNKKNFRVVHKEFDLKTRKSDMTLKSTKIIKYTIMSNGKFVKQK